MPLLVLLNSWPAKGESLISICSETDGLTAPPTNEGCLQ